MFQSKDYIYEIYRCGSFSAAARNLYITQPAISIAVKKEEQELGQPIFERSSSHLLLTDAGRAYIDAVEKLHRIEDDLKIYCNDLSNLKTFPDWLPAVLLGDRRWRADSASAAAHGAGLLRLR